MARRRLLSILAGSALLTATFAGPAAAVELVDASQEPVAEVTEDPAEVAGQVAEDVEGVVGAVADEPVAEVTEVIEETVAPAPNPEPTPEPTPPAPTAPADEEAAAPAAVSSDAPRDALVAAGEVTAAPSLAFLTGTGGSAAPATQSRLDLPLATLAVDSAPPASEAVPAPQVAPAPAAATVVPAPSMAQTVSRVVRDEGTPIVVLVAIASLLAAGLGTVREARAAAA